MQITNTARDDQKRRRRPAARFRFTFSKRLTFSSDDGKIPLRNAQRTQQWIVFKFQILLPGTKHAAWLSSRRFYRHTWPLTNLDAGGEFGDELAPAVVTVQDLMQE
jgi:hypothetical protein